ncbi:hypothetical protein SB719_21280, partial [Pantoea sp. SIMBA_079]|uniref:hypothetical protein n=1 Tax=Pantoea sp. SIMBA_079 TaxID=3085817 RepID=UPI003994CFC0
EGNAFVGITLESYIPTSQEEFIIVNNLTKRFVISNNLVTGNGYNFGILTNITAGSVPYGTSLDGKVTVSGNELSDFQRGIYLRV